MPPLGDAVRFVDGDERDRHTDGEVAESFGFQTFRRHVQQFELFLNRQPADVNLFVRRLSGVDERGRKAHVVQGVDLVAHE